MVITFESLFFKVKHYEEIFARNRKPVLGDHGDIILSFRAKNGIGS